MKNCAKSCPQLSKNEESVDNTNVHRQKVVCEGQSFSWGGARTKGKGRECELTKKMLLYSGYTTLFRSSRRDMMKNVER